MEPIQDMTKQDNTSTAPTTRTDLQDVPDVVAQPSLEAAVQAAEALVIERAVEAAAVGYAALKTLLGELNGSDGLTANVAIVVATRLIEMGHPDDAHDIIAPFGSEDYRADRVRAFALARMGRKTDEAIAILERLRAEGHVDFETLGLLAGRYKQRGRDTGSSADLQKAYLIYLDAYEDTGDTYPGINAASLALELGEKEESNRIAGEIALELENRPKADLDLWKFATLGEAHLLKRDLGSARKWYRRAVAADPNAAQNIATMRRQARLNLRALALDEDGLDDLLVVRKVAAFAGHMVDADDRPNSRFPQALEGKIRRAIREKLRELNVGFGFCSAARGSDLLFLEELLERGGSAQVYLPFPREDFVASSVGAGWQARFDQILADPRVRVVVLRSESPSADETEAAFDSCNATLQKKAVQRAQQLGEEPLMLAVWDGAEGDGRGGTADAVQKWRNQGFDAEVIALRPANAQRAAPKAAQASVVQKRDMTGDTDGSPVAWDYANRYCLCIGISEYENAPWSKLRNATNDAEEVSHVLTTSQGFTDTLLLLDDQATKERIGSTITKDLRKRAGADDLVVVFYAGHGHTVTMGGQEHGFIVPVRGADNPDRLISINELTDWSTWLESRHVLYIFDSCFSGMFQRMSGGDRMEPDVTRARIAITAGQADQTVYDGLADTDHSVFTHHLLQALRDGVGPDILEGEFTSTVLYSFVQKHVKRDIAELSKSKQREYAPQTPTHATLRNHEGGEIAFRLPNPPA